MSEVLSQPTNEWLNKFKELVPTNGDIEVLRFDDNTAALLIQDNSAMPWLLVEDSLYKTDLRQLYYIDEDEKYPFITTGNQWFVDLERDRVLHRVGFCGEEGSIQGFVYALFAITHAGEVSPDNYKDYFRGEIQKALDNDVFNAIEADDIEKIKEIIEGP